jgi:hypothetical protein
MQKDPEPASHEEEYIAVLPRACFCAIEKAGKRLAALNWIEERTFTPCHEAERMDHGISGETVGLAPLRIVHHYRIVREIMFGFEQTQSTDSNTIGHLQSLVDRREHCEGEDALRRIAGDGHAARQSGVGA